LGKKEKRVAKVVLDTNTIVSALLFKGYLSEIVDLWKNRAILPVFSKDFHRVQVRVQPNLIFHSAGNQVSFQIV